MPKRKLIKTNSSLFTPAEWNDIKGGKLTVYLNAKERKALLARMGYSVDKEGFLVDKTKQRVKLSKGLELKPEDIKGMVGFGSSRVFIRNIGDLAEVLAKRDELLLYLKSGELNGNGL